METSSIINILNAHEGKFEEQVLNPNATDPKGRVLREALNPYPRDARKRITVDPELAAMALKESGGTLSTANFPDLLRQGMIFDAFTGYAETPVTYPQFARVVDSSKQQEEYLKDAALGLMPVVKEGEAYPEAAVETGDSVTIKNYKRGYIISVTEEMQKFDQVGKVRDLAELQGRSARLTEEMAVMDVLTTTTNYTRTSTAGDNDETAVGSGANQQTLTFSPTGLITAFNVLQTMKDRKTGVKLGVRPNVLIVSPKLRWAAMQLIKSKMAVRAYGAAETYGTGEENQFFDIVDTVIVSPYFGNGYEWALLERGRAITFQRVEPFTILRERADGGGESFTRDLIRYRAKTWFGVGMRDDRFAFFSNSTTAPAVN